MCDHCGTMWRLSQLRRDAAGSLTCPDEGRGLSGVALDEITAANSRNQQGPQVFDHGGTFVGTNVAADGTVDESVYVQRLTLEDIES